MKMTILMLLSFLSFEVSAACRCSCNMMDTRLCANGYDLAQPCPSSCKSQSSSVASVNTACPPVHIYNPNTGTSTVSTACPE